jgi:hypothetical protein
MTMPGFDGTGPRGMGPMTGGGRGFCNPMSPLFGARGMYPPASLATSAYGAMPFAYGRGMGVGFGAPVAYGRGMGMGFGRRGGRGRGMGGGRGGGRGWW